MSVAWETIEESSLKFYKNPRLFPNFPSVLLNPGTVQYYIVVGQPLKSSVTWIIPKGGYLNSHILNCTIIVSTVKYRDFTS